MARRDRDIDGEEAPEVDDGIPTDRQAGREYHDSQKAQCRNLTHASRRKRMSGIEGQGDAREDHDPKQREGTPILVAGFCSLGPLLERKADLRHDINESEPPSYRIVHGRFPDRAGPNNLSSGPCCASLIIRSNLSPI